MDENKNADTLEKGKRHWYVIHTYSGYENKVSANLERKVHSLGMSDRIFVMKDGRVSGEFLRSPELNEEDLIKKMV